jgi:hypothetical protein
VRGYDLHHKTVLGQCRSLLSTTETITIIE